MIGHEFIQQHRQDKLQRQAQRDAKGTADEAEPQPLDQVDGEAGPCARAEAAQHRHGGEPLADEHMHRARHADRPEEQRQEADEAREGKYVLQRVADLLLAFLGRGEVEPLTAQLVAEFLLQRPGVGGRRQFQVEAVLGQAALLEKIGPLQRGHRDLHARRKHRGEGRLAGIFLQHPDDRERGRAELDFITDPEPGLRERRLLDDRVGALGQTRKRPGGHGLDLAVERETALDGAQLDEAPLAVAKGCHGRGADALRGFRAGRAEAGQRLAGKCLPRSNRKVGAEQAFRLRVDRGAEVVPERTDADERRHAQDDGQGIQQQPAPRSARIPPGHLQDEIHNFARE